MKISKKSQGFTLIELMIVVAIIAILAGIAIPQYQKYIARTQLNRVVAELGGLRTPFEVCMNNGQLVEGTSPNQCDLRGTVSNLLITQSDISISTSGYIEGEMGNTAASVLSGTIVSWSRSPAGTWICEITPSTDPGFPVQAVPTNCTVI